MSENPCKDVGCPGYCCMDMEFDITEQDFNLMRQNYPFHTLDDKTFTKLLSYRARKIEDPNSTDTRGWQPPGIYYCEGRGAIFHRVTCPSLREGECSIYDQRPFLCSQFKFESRQCDVVRATTPGNFIIDLNSIPVLVEA